MDNPAQYVLEPGFKFVNPASLMYFGQGGDHQSLHIPLRHAMARHLSLKLRLGGPLERRLGLDAHVCELLLLLRPLADLMVRPSFHNLSLFGCVSRYAPSHTNTTFSSLPRTLRRVSARASSCDSLLRMHFGVRSSVGCLHLVFLISNDFSDGLPIHFFVDQDLTDPVAPDPRPQSSLTAQTLERHARYIIFRNCRPRPSLPSAAASAVVYFAAAASAAVSRALPRAVRATAAAFAGSCGRTAPLGGGSSGGGQGGGGALQPDVDGSERRLRYKQFHDAADGRAPAQRRTAAAQPVFRTGASQRPDPTHTNAVSGEEGGAGGERCGSVARWDNTAALLELLFKAHLAESTSRPRGGGGRGGERARARASMVLAFSRAATGSVWGTSRPLAAALCKRWLPALLLPLVLVGVATAAAQLHIALYGRPAAGRRFRFTALEARGAPGRRATTAGLAGLGLTVDGCGEGPSRLGPNLTFGPEPAQVTLTFPQRVTANGWWFVTRSAAMAAAAAAAAAGNGGAPAVAADEAAAAAAAAAGGEDPVRFILEQSEEADDGDAACGSAATANSGALNASSPPSAASAKACGWGRWVVVSGSSSTWTWAGGFHWGTGLYPTAPPTATAYGKGVGFTTAPAANASATAPAVGPAEMERAEVMGLLAPRMWLVHRMAHSATAILLGAALLIAVACRCFRARMTARVHAFGACTSRARAEPDLGVHQPNSHSSSKQTRQPATLTFSCSLHR